jgi:diguanylate cyclase (GGDEF)-like protein
VVSGDRALSESLLEMLGESGHEASRAHNTVAARFESAKLRPQLALVDMAFRSSSHTRLIRSLHALGVPLVFGLVRSTKPNQLGTALEAPIDDVLELPIAPELLTLRVKAAADRIWTGERARQRDTPDEAPALELDLRALEGSDAPWEWDLNDHIFVADRSWNELLGLDDPEVSTDPESWLERIHPADSERFRGAVYDHLLGVLPQLRSTVRIRHGDGSYHWFMARGRAQPSSTAEGTRLCGLLTEITDARRQSLTEADEHGIDPVTGLIGKPRILERINRALARIRRLEQGSLAVLALDLDRFRRVTDSLGPAAADRLLRAVAERLQQVASDTVTLARYSGDEFIVLVDDIGSLQDAINVANELERQLLAPFDVEDMDVVTTTSIGLVVLRDDHQHAEELVRDADTAMHHAKRLGGHRLNVFDPEIRTQEIQRLVLESDLYRAIANNELRVAFQPIVRLADGRIIGFEALVRWYHPERGLIPPGEFVPLAEETGLIIPIDRWVAETACAQLRSWQTRYRQPALTVSVNISSTQFLQPDLVAQLDHIVRKTGLYGASLNVEVTESLIVEHASHAAAMLRQLKKLDIGISVDDFGTGYSSLSYLRRFDIDTVKIDASFVSTMLVEEDSLEIVRAIATLARRLGKSTVVEGVEVGTQIEVVRSMEADCVQGFYLSPPLQAETLQPVLDAAFECAPHLDALLALRPQIAEELVEFDDTTA